jgi:hypothetical protein
MSHTQTVHKQMIYIIQMKIIYGLMEILDYNVIHYKM